MTVSVAVSQGFSLSSTEGTLVSVSIPIDPSHLEALLDAIARLDFPINPQIYHDAEVVHVYADGHEESEPVTLVEFPAYAAHLPEVERALDAYAFDPASIQIFPMLDALRTDSPDAPAPSGAPYIVRRHRKARQAES